MNLDRRTIFRRARKVSARGRATTLTACVVCGRGVVRVIAFHLKIPALPGAKKPRKNKGIRPQFWPASLLPNRKGCMRLRATSTGGLALP